MHMELKSPKVQSLVQTPNSLKDVKMTDSFNKHQNAIKELDSPPECVEKLVEHYQVKKVVAYNLEVANKDNE